MKFTFLTYLLDALFPPQCIPCGKKLPSSSLFVSACPECLAKIPIRTGFVCSGCGARQYSIHNECHRGAPIIAAATEYANKEAQMLIHALKYEHIQTAAAPLANIIARYLETREEILGRGPFALMPIPLHKKKEWKREYNQSMLIAQELVTKFPDTFILRDDVLKRVKDTPSQTAQKSHTERNKNIIDAFEVVHADVIVGKIVFLLDDVSTSGATIREASKMLKHSGARSVVGIVVAKA